MREFSHVMTALAVSCCLVLSACSGGPGDPGGLGPQGGDGSNDAKAPVYTWGDWVDLGFTANLELANDSYAAFRKLDDMTHAVYDTSGNKVWDVPTLKPITMSVYNTLASDELFIAEVENGDLVGFTWADGAEKWRLNPAEILQCDPGDAASWSVASRTEQRFTTTRRSCWASSIRMRSTTVADRQATIRALSPSTQRRVKKNGVDQTLTETPEPLPLSPASQANTSTPRGVRTCNIR